jgi:membrane-bound lytic murein transglycosylase D
MVRRLPQRGFLTLLSATLVFGIACGSSRKAAPQVTLPPAAQSLEFALPPAADLPPTPPDRAVTLIAASDRHFKAGQIALELGHVDAARQEFNRAIEVLLESSSGGRSEPRIRDHFDRLVDRISAYELRALADGDGFTEKQYEPASIDELLALSATLTPEPTPEVEAAVQNDPVAHDIPIPLNQRVLAYIELFRGRLRDFLQSGMQRGAKYLPMIQDVFRAEGLPLDLAYIPLVESAFKPNALSRAKAKGVWQFMRGTGLENGLRQDWYVDERSDPEKATVAAAKYLKTLSRMFDEDWHLVLASYNGGPGRVQRAMTKGRSDDFWRLSSRKTLLPRETRDYVPMILAAVVIARNPVQYGFDVVNEPPLSYDTVVLERPTDLRRVAEWADTTIEEIQALNPELRRWTTPVRDSAYEIKVPSGLHHRVTGRLADVETADFASLRKHTVKSGETLASIARKLRVKRTDLAEANYLRTSARLTPGQQLIVPHEPTVLMALNADRPAPTEVQRNQPEPRLVAFVADSAAADSGTEDRVRISYRVKKGDTLGSIARMFKTTVALIRSWNSIDGNRILIGERLVIYTSARAN